MVGVVRRSGDRGQLGKWGKAETVGVGARGGESCRVQGETRGQGRGKAGRQAGGGKARVKGRE